jgi:translation elongation factor EF-1alpha
MDLVDYSEEVYNKIKALWSIKWTKSTFKEQNVSYIPLSALTGDNVSEKSGCYAVQRTNDPRTPWGTWTSRCIWKDKHVFVQMWFDQKQKNTNI